MRQQLWKATTLGLTFDRAERKMATSAAPAQAATQTPYYQIYRRSACVCCSHVAVRGARDGEQSARVDISSLAVTVAGSARRWSKRSMS